MSVERTCGLAGLAFASFLWTGCGPSEPLLAPSGNWGLDDADRGVLVLNLDAGGGTACWNGLNAAGATAIFVEYSARWTIVGDGTYQVELDCVDASYCDDGVCPPVVTGCSPLERYIDWPTVDFLLDCSVVEGRDDLECVERYEGMTSSPFSFDRDAPVECRTQ